MRDDIIVAPGFNPGEKEAGTNDFPRPKKVFLCNGSVCTGRGRQGVGEVLHIARHAIALARVDKIEQAVLGREVRNHESFSHPLYK